VPRTSYLRALTGPPAGNVAVLHPPHKPLWGLPSAFGQRSFGLPNESLLVPSSPVSHQEDRAREPKADQRTKEDEPAPSSHFPQTVEVQSIGHSARSTERLPDGAARTSVRAQEHQAPANSVAPLSPSNIGPPSGSSHPPPIPNRHTVSAEEQAHLALASAEVATKASSAEAAPKPPSEVRPEPLTAELRARDYNQSASGQSHRPHPSPAQGAQGPGGAADKTIRIGTIDIQVVPPATPPRRTPPRRQSPSPATSLSRGFTSSYGLQQG
jgi:hypothetical protein